MGDQSPTSARGRLTGGPIDGQNKKSSPRLPNLLIYKFQKYPEYIPKVTRHFAMLFVLLVQNLLFIFFKKLLIFILGYFTYDAIYLNTLFKVGKHWPGLDIISA